MRIAYVCADLGIPVFGRKGCSIHVQEVIRALIDLGAAIELFTVRPEGERPQGLESVRLHGLPFVAPAGRAAREQAALRANDQFLAALERAGPFDLVYERYALWSYAGMEYARVRGMPGLLEVNAPLVEEETEYRGLIDRAAACRVAERVFAAATALIAVSEELAAYLQRFPGTHGRVHVIPNGVDPRRFPAGLPPSCPGPPGVFTVGFVGTLKPWHGLATLVEAFALLQRAVPKVRLLIVGDGPERPRLEEHLRSHGLQEAACFTGAVSPGAVPGLLASMDVAVAPYPSLASFYFSPLKVFEYLTAGLAVVASRVGQVAAVIEHEVNGLLCPAGVADELATALVRLHREPGLRSRLGQAARATVLQNYTWEAVGHRILRLAALDPEHRESATVRASALALPGGGCCGEMSSA
ncbi:MAG TPA: glycosyltransferase family 4 protein [Gemmataceae bacterium]|nr:glycosyltransferase family 4 protein [Gemmataceae bacterium]